MGKMVLVAALFTSVAFASGVMAQPTSPAPATKVEKHRFSGVIEKVDPKAKTVTVRGKVEERGVLKSKMEDQDKVMTFVINDKTKINGAIRSNPFENLKNVTHAAVDYFIPPKSGKTYWNPVAVEIEYSTPKFHPVKK